MVAVLMIDLQLTWLTREALFVVSFCGLVGVCGCVLVCGVGSIAVTY